MRSLIGLSLFVLAPAWASPHAAGQDLYDDGVLRHLSLTFHQADWWQQLKDNRILEIYIPADLEVDGVVYLDVGVRLRGKSSFMAPGKKKPFKIKMDEFVPGQELYSYDSLRLNNGMFDPTWMREIVMERALRDYMPLANRNFVTLECNGESWGLYVNEQQKDRAWMGEHYLADWGNRYASVAGHGFTWLGSNPSSYAPFYELKNDPGNDPFLDLIALCDVANHVQEGEALTNALLPIFDLDEFLWFTAGDIVLGNLDSYAGNSNNWYLVNDMHHGRLAAVNHDLNLSFGTWDGLGHDVPLNHGFGNVNRPLVYRVMKDLQTKREYLAHAKTLVEDVFRWDVIGPLVDEYRALIDAEVQADPKKIYTYQEYLDSMTQAIDVGFWIADAFQPYVEMRHDFLINHAVLNWPQVEFGLIRHLPGRPEPNEEVTVTAEIDPGVNPSKVELRWRVRGHFIRTPMFDDGQSGDGAAGDYVFGSTIPAQDPGARVEYYLVATAKQKGFKTFAPRKGEFAPLVFDVAFGGSGVRVTEYMYSGAGGEFIELTNTTLAALDLTGWSLDDESADPGSLDLTPAGSLQPGQSLVICEADPTAFVADWGSTGAVLMLGNDLTRLGRNDAIYLFDDLGVVRDRLVFGDEALPGSVRAKESSARACAGALGKDDVYLWSLSAVGDEQGSWTSMGGDVGSPGAYLAVDCPELGVDYCASAANSTGAAAQLRAEGSARISDNDLRLRVRMLPPGQPGYLLMSADQGQIPAFGGSQGTLCLGGSIIRFPAELRFADPGGSVHLTPNLAALPQDTVIASGEQWSFQWWYRDSNPTATSNTSNGLEVAFH